MDRTWKYAIAVMGIAAGLGPAGGRLDAAELPAADIREMEQLLSQLNFDPGAIDGVVDERTRTAIRLYQEFAVLPVNGQPDAKLLQELRQVSQVYAEMRQAPPAETPEASTPKAETPGPQVATAAAPEVTPALDLAPDPASEPAQAEAPPPEEAEAEVEPAKSPPLVSSDEAPPTESASTAVPSLGTAKGAPLQDEAATPSPPQSASLATELATEPTAEPEPQVAKREAASPAVPEAEKPMAAAPEEPALDTVAPAESLATDTLGTQPAPAPAPASAEAPVRENPVAETQAAAAAPVASPATTAPSQEGAGPSEGFSLAGMIARLKQNGGAEPPANRQPPPAASGSDPAGTQRTLIWKTQHELKRIGIDPGPTDGSMRDLTRRAIHTYQRARGLPADGRVSEALLARLEAEAAPEAPAPGAAGALDSVVAQPDAINAVPRNGYEAFKAGYGAAQAGDYDTAIKLYEKAIDGGDLALEHLADALYNRANAYQYLGVLDKAIDDYSAAIANKPNFPAAYYNRGFAFDLKGAQGDAVKDFRKARDLGLQRLGVRSPDLPPPLL